MQAIVPAEREGDNREHIAIYDNEHSITAR